MNFVYLVKKYVLNRKINIVFECSFVTFAVDRSDPFASAAAQHFNSILQRFGSPVIVFNLVKVIICLGKYLVIYMCRKLI